MYLSERIATCLKVSNQEVIALGKDAYIVSRRSKKVVCCLWDDLGSVVVHPGDQTDNDTHDEVMAVLNEVRASVYV